MLPMANSLAESRLREVFQTCRPLCTKLMTPTLDGPALMQLEQCLSTLCRDIVSHSLSLLSHQEATVKPLSDPCRITATAVAQMTEYISLHLFFLLQRQEVAKREKERCLVIFNVLLHCCHIANFLPSITPFPDAHTLHQQQHAIPSYLSKKFVYQWYLLHLSVKEEVKETEDETFLQLSITNVYLIVQTAHRLVSTVSEPTPASSPVSTDHPPSLFSLDLSRSLQLKQEDEEEEDIYSDQDTINSHSLSSISSVVVNPFHPVLASSLQWHLDLFRTGHHQPLILASLSAHLLHFHDFIRYLVPLTASSRWSSSLSLSVSSHLLQFMPGVLSPLCQFVCEHINTVTAKNDVISGTFQTLTDYMQRVTSLLTHQTLPNEHQRPLNRLLIKMIELRVDSEPRKQSMLRFFKHLLAHEITFYYQHHRPWLLLEKDTFYRLLDDLIAHPSEWIAELLHLERELSQSAPHPIQEDTLTRLQKALQPTDSHHTNPHTPERLLHDSLLARFRDGWHALPSQLCLLPADLKNDDTLSAVFSVTSEEDKQQAIRVLYSLLTCLSDNDVCGALSSFTWFWPWVRACTLAAPSHDAQRRDPRLSMSMSLLDSDTESDAASLSLVCVREHASQRWLCRLFQQLRALPETQRTVSQFLVARLEQLQGDALASVLWMLSLLQGASLIEELSQAKYWQLPQENSVSTQLVLLLLRQQLQASGKDAAGRLFLKRLLWPLLEKCALLEEVDGGSPSTPSVALLARQVMILIGDDYVRAHLHYIVHAMTIRLRHAAMHPHIAQHVLAALRLFGSDLMPYVHDLVGDLIHVMHHQRYTSSSSSSSSSLLLLSPCDNNNNNNVSKDEDASWMTLSFLGCLEGICKILCSTDKEENTALIHSENALTQQEASVATLKSNDLVRIARHALQYVSSDEIKIRAMALSILTACVGGITEDNSERLPLIHELWPYLMHRLKDEGSLYVVIHAVACLRAVFLAGKEFVARRSTKEVLPVLLRVLNIGEENERENRAVVMLPRIVEGAPMVQAQDPYFRQSLKYKVWMITYELLTTMVTTVSLSAEDIYRVVMCVVDHGQGGEALLHTMIDHGKEVDAIWLALMMYSDSSTIKVPLCFRRATKHHDMVMPLLKKIEGMALSI